MIQAIFYDDFGKRTGTAMETEADLHARRKPSTVRQMTREEACLEMKGTQRRPARHDTRFS